MTTDLHHVTPSYTMLYHVTTYYTMLYHVTTDLFHVTCIQELSGTLPWIHTWIQVHLREFLADYIDSSLLCWIFMSKTNSWQLLRRIYTNSKEAIRGHSCSFFSVASLQMRIWACLISTWGDMLNIVTGRTS